jgi:hypothetical protein
VLHQFLPGFAEAFNVPSARKRSLLVVFRLRGATHVRSLPVDEPFALPCCSDLAVPPPMFKPLEILGGWLGAMDVAPLFEMLLDWRPSADVGDPEDDDDMETGDGDDASDADDVLAAPMVERSRHLRIAAGLFKLLIPPSRLKSVGDKHVVRVAYRLNGAHSIVRVFPHDDVPVHLPLPADLRPVLAGLDDDVSVFFARLYTPSAFGVTTEEDVLDRLRTLWPQGTQSLRCEHTGAFVGPCSCFARPTRLFFLLVQASRCRCAPSSACRRPARATRSWFGTRWARSRSATASTTRTPSSCRTPAT